LTPLLSIFSLKLQWTKDWKSLFEIAGVTLV